MHLIILQKHVVFCKTPPTSAAQRAFLTCRPSKNTTPLPSSLNPSLAGSPQLASGARLWGTGAKGRIQTPGSAGLVRPVGRPGATRSEPRLPLFSASGFGGTGELGGSGDVWGWEEANGGGKREDG